MSNIYIPGNAKHNKDCPHWQPLKDGTRTGDTKYCDLSLQCKQLGMRTDWYWFLDVETGEKSFDYFCTGCYLSKEDKGVDKEIT